MDSSFGPLPLLFFSGCQIDSEENVYTGHGF